MANFKRISTKSWSFLVDSWRFLKILACFGHLQPLHGQFWTSFVELFGGFWRFLKIPPTCLGFRSVPRRNPTDSASFLAVSQRFHSVYRPLELKFPKLTLEICHQLTNCRRNGAKRPLHDYFIMTIIIKKLAINSLNWIANDYGRGNGNCWWMHRVPVKSDEAVNLPDSGSVRITSAVRR